MLKKFLLKIDNVFFLILCLFPITTALFKHTIYLYFAMVACWYCVLVYRNSLINTILGFLEYLCKNSLFLSLIPFALYIIYHLYFISDYPSPTFKMQFLPFHLTSLFGFLLLYIARLERFDNRLTTFSLSGSIAVYLIFCVIFIAKKPNETSLIIRHMLPFLFLVISCLLIMDIYRKYRHNFKKSFIMQASLVAINALLIFLSDGNTSKLLFVISLAIGLVCYFIKNKHFLIMSMGVILAVVTPISIASIKDFSIFNTKLFHKQLRSIQTRTPQWMYVLDHFEQNPMTGQGVYASYYIAQRTAIGGGATTINDILEEEHYNDMADQNNLSKKYELETSLEKLVNSVFLINRTNQYYQLKRNITNPVYGDRFFNAIKDQVKSLDLILDMLKELKQIQLNITLKARISSSIEYFQQERLYMEQFLEAYETANTYDAKHMVLKQELERFLSYPQFQIVTHPHNIILHALFELGILGIVFLLITLFYILYKISKIEVVIYRAIGYILYFIFLTLYSTASSIWYIDFHQIMYIVAFIFIVISTPNTKQKLAND